VRPLKAVLIAVVVGVLAGLGMRILGGMAAQWAVLLAVPVAAVTLVGLLSPRGAEPIWAPLPEPLGGATEHQAAALASRLAESVDYPTASWRWPSCAGPGSRSWRTRGRCRCLGPRCTCW
jgi:hypothetical protein